MVETGEHARANDVARTRRTPSQRRSIDKVRRVLDACQRLAEELPPAEITTNLIAARAGVSVGSLYEYFPDKAAVFDAVLARYLESFDDVLGEVFAAPAPADWAEASDAAVDAFARYYRAEPAFRALWFGGYRTAGVAAFDRQNNTVLIGRWRSLLVSHGLVADDPELDLAFTICWELADHLLDLAFWRDANGDERVLAEAKSILRDYMGRHLGTPSTMLGG